MWKLGKPFIVINVWFMKQRLENYHPLFIYKTAVVIRLPAQQVRTAYVFSFTYKMSGIAVFPDVGFLLFTCQRILHLLLKCVHVGTLR